MKKISLLIFSLWIMMFMGCSNPPEEEKKPTKIIEVTFQIVDPQGKPIRKQISYGYGSKDGLTNDMAYFTNDQGQGKQKLAVGKRYIFQVGTDPQPKEILIKEKDESKMIPIRANLENSQKQE
ncbi:MAG: hypothetical protein WB502_13660 [Thermoactinomyces sp.]